MLGVQLCRMLTSLYCTSKGARLCQIENSRIYDCFPLPSELGPKYDRVEVQNNAFELLAVFGQMHYSH